MRGLQRHHVRIRANRSPTISENMLAVFITLSRLTGFAGFQLVTHLQQTHRCHTAIGSGKTHTMNGNEANPGIIPLAIRCPSLAHSSYTHSGAIPTPIN